MGARQACHGIPHEDLALTNRPAHDETPRATDVPTAAPQRKNPHRPGCLDCNPEHPEPECYFPFALLGGGAGVYYYWRISLRIGCYH